MAEELDKLKKLIGLWPESAVTLGIAADWALRSGAGVAGYFDLVFGEILPRATRKAKCIQAAFVMSLLMRSSPQDLLRAVGNASRSISDEALLDILARHFWKFNQTCLGIPAEEIPDIVQENEAWGHCVSANAPAPIRRARVAGGLRRARAMPKKGEEPACQLLGVALDRDDENLPATLGENVFRHTPLLQYYSQDSALKAAKPFDGKHVVMVLHFLRDLLPFVEAACLLGLDPANATVFYKAYPYPQRKAVAQWLGDKGCEVLPVSQIPAYLEKTRTARRLKRGPLLIIEDGGFFVPLLHRDFRSLLCRTIGAVEQTTRGIMNAEQYLKENPSSKLAIPLISVAGSDLKADFEPPYIAKAVLRNISAMLPEMAWAGKEVGILGFGTIGQQLAQWLTTNGAKVTAYDSAGEKALLAHQQGGIGLAATSKDAVSGKHFVIGASGRPSIDAEAISYLTHNTYLVSASSEQYEIDIDELKRRSTRRADLRDQAERLIGTDFLLAPDDRCVHMLANGYPVNFWGMESMPGEASDVILSLILLAAAEVARGTYQEPGINSGAVNEIADDQHYGVAKMFVRMHAKP